MAQLPRPDPTIRTPEGTAAIFRHFGEVECPTIGGHVYAALCEGIARDADLLAMAAHAPPTQPPPNLLFAAVQYLLLRGSQDRLRAWYPLLSERAPRDPAEAFGPFRDFCLSHRPAIEALIETRLTQSNVIQRTGMLLPAFARIFERGGSAPLALIEVGASAGLNLQWDHFRYRYQPKDGVGPSWGDPNSPVLVSPETRGDGGLPALPAAIPVGWRRGVDIHPIPLEDDDALTWLRALVWPEHVGNHERLSAAIEIAQRHPPEILEGDAGKKLPEVIALAPKEATLCIYGTHTLYQFPREALIATLQAMQTASRARPIDFLSMEGTGDGRTELRWTAYRDGQRDTVVAAPCSPHGHWIEWLGNEPG